MIYTVTLNPAIDRTIIVEKLQNNTVLKAKKVFVNCGGKGFNVSRSLKRMGMESVVVGCVGGPPGQVINAELTKLDISARLITIEGETRTNTVILEEDGTQHLKVNETGPTLSNKEQAALMDEISRLSSADDLWIISGSLPGDTPPTFYRELIHMLHRKKVRVFLDTSGRALAEGVQASPNLIKPNLDELGELTGKEIGSIKSIIDAVEELQRWEINDIVVSIGAKGALYWQAGKIVHSPAPVVQISNPTGAGDAFLSGIVLANQKNWTLEQTVAFGVAAGTASAVKEGVDFCSINEILPYYDWAMANVVVL